MKVALRGIMYLCGLEAADLVETQLNINNKNIPG
jgi:hypothetical protein